MRHYNCTPLFYRHSSLQCGFEPPKSSLSSILRPKNWVVSFASTPDDIYWENLNVSKSLLTLKYIAINLGIFIMAFFLTTPEFLVTQTDWIIPILGDTFKVPGPIIDFLPTLLLWSFTALLPLLISYSDRWMGYYTRSEVCTVGFQKSLRIPSVRSKTTPITGCVCGKWVDHPFC